MWSSTHKELDFFIWDPLTDTYISLMCDTLFNPLSDTLFEFLNGVWSEIQPLDRTGVFRKSSFEFLKLNDSPPHLILPLNNHEQRAYTISLDKKKKVLLIF